MSVGFRSVGTDQGRIDDDAPIAIRWVRQIESRTIPPTFLSHRPLALVGDGESNSAPFVPLRFRLS